MRTCVDCKYVQGDECIRYNGPVNAACGLVPGAWYKINDLIAALLCVGNTGAGESGCDNCICLSVNGVNYADSWGANVQAVLSYKLYADQEHTALIVSRELTAGQTNTYKVKGSLPYSKVYPVINLNFDRIDPAGNYYTNGFGIDLIVVAGGQLLFAGSVASPAEGPFTFSGLPLELPTGEISIFIYENKFDTNDDYGQGVIAMGGDRLSASVFTLNLEMAGGGSVSSQSLVWPQDDGSQDFVYSNYDTLIFGSQATALNLSISGVNNEGGPLAIHFDASQDSALSFSETVAAGGSYQKDITLTAEQAKDNDFMIRIIGAQ